MGVRCCFGSMMSMAEGTPRRVTSHRLLATTVGNGLAGCDWLSPLQAARAGYSGPLTATPGAQKVDELAWDTPPPTNTPIVDHPVASRSADPVSVLSVRNVR